MRLFFGASIDKKHRNDINSIINTLKPQYKGKYTDIDNLHITIVFVGEVEQKVSYMLSHFGDLVFSEMPKFSIRTGGIGAFKRGGIHYLGVEESKELKNAHTSIISLLHDNDIEYNGEVEYTPHITLRRGCKCDIEMNIPPMDIEIDTLCLYESKRVDGVLRYVPIKSWTLGEDGKNED